MPANELFIAVGFSTGLTGSVHCIAMCGGLVGVISGSMKVSPKRAALYWIGYQSGRIISYTIAGFLVAGIASQAASLFPFERSHDAGALIAGFFLVILGGHIAGWWTVLRWIERAGGRLWGKIIPKLTRFFSPRLIRHSVMGGLIWGWIPCGLVYSALGFAAVSNSVWLGGLTMLAFGLGTIPMLIALIAVSSQVERLRRFSSIKTFTGAAVCILGGLVMTGVLPIHFMHAAL